MADEEDLENTSNIVEESTDIDSFLLKDGDTINGATLNRILAVLGKNDETIAGNFKELPGIWFCKWYDNELAKGYSKGDFFWVNTENIENFIRDNNEKIMDLANKNPFVKKKLPKWKNNDSEVFDMYYNALTGYVDNEVSKPLPPIYYPGHISNDFQIIVSQKDRNKDIPGTDEAIKSWKHFAVNTDEDYENMLFVINKLVLSALNRHVDEYHVGGTIPSRRDIYSLSTNYANEDFSNVTISYPKNYVQNDFQTEGMDCVDVYVRKPYVNRNIGKFNFEHTWFRKWKSGFLEHGGLIDVRRYLNVYGDLVTIPFSWKMLDDESRLYELDYLGSDGSPIEVDESYQLPPGDNLISVLHELDDLYVDNSEYAPIYYRNNYFVTLVPIQQQFIDNNDIGNVESYIDLGYHNIKDNVLNAVTNIDSSFRKTDSFSFEYNANTTPNYYSYYVRGFCI